MSSTNQQREVIYEFTAWEFLKRIEEMVLKGYRLDDSNENFPVVSVGSYSCGMIKDVNLLSTKTEAITPPEVQQEKPVAKAPSTSQATTKRGNKK